jgi:hypothetical protein
LIGSNHESSSDNESPKEVVKQTKETLKKSIPNVPIMDKLLNPILVIPPNIPSTSIPSINDPFQGSQERFDKSTIKSPIVEIISNPPIQEVPLISKPPLVTPTFYRTPGRCKRIQCYLLKNENIIGL